MTLQIADHFGSNRQNLSVGEKDAAYSGNAGTAREGMALKKVV
ncbi:hypothetical protein [Gimesia sp.]|nr:hypothetical protein [Gimesia sp.]